MQKCGFCDRKFSGAQLLLVKLHRPPPEMRIFSPGTAACSRTRTERPRLPAFGGPIMPAAPAPTTTTPRRSTSAPPVGFVGILRQRSVLVLGFQLQTAEFRLARTA